MELTFWGMPFIPKQYINCHTRAQTWGNPTTIIAYFHFHYRNKMTTLYQQSIPVLVKYLKNLSFLLQKGATFCEEKSLKHEEMLSYRLISDMRGQVPSPQ